MSAGGRKHNSRYQIASPPSKEGLSISEIPGACLGLLVHGSIRLLVAGVILYGAYLSLSEVLRFTKHGGLPGAVHVSVTLKSLQELGSTLGSTKTPFQDELRDWFQDHTP